MKNYKAGAITSEHKPMTREQRAKKIISTMVKYHERRWITKCK